MGRRVLGAMGVVGLVVVTALDQGPAPDPDLDGLRVVTQQVGGSSGSDALLGGTLGAVGDCVGLVAPDGGPGDVVAWPRGTEVEDGEIRTPGGIRVRLGEDFHGGGGSFAPTDTGFLRSAEIPDTCVEAMGPTGSVAVLNPDQ